MSEPQSPSTTISHYCIISKIGEGGMGEVYLAQGTQLHRNVAIKFLPEKLLADEQARKRLIEKHERRPGWTTQTSAQSMRSGGPSRNEIQNEKHRHELATS